MKSKPKFQIITYTQLKRYEQAIDHYTKVIDASPTFAIPYTLRGDIYFEIQRFDEAISDYSTAINLLQWQWKDDIYYSRGLAYQAKGEIDLANQDFAKANQYPQD